VTDTPTSRSLWLLATALLIADVTSSLETSMLLTAMPAIMREPAIGTAAGWLVTAFVLSQIASAAIGGRFGDRLGRRRVLLVVLLLCLGGSLLSALSPWFSGIMIGRVVQGASGAILPLSYGIIREHSPGHRVRFWIGVVSGAYSAAGALGFVLGGALTEGFGWRSIFLATALLPVAAMGMVMLWVPRDRPAGVFEGVPGFLTGLVFLPAIAAILIGLDERLLTGWPLAGRGLLVGAGVAALILWYRHQRASPARLIDVALLSDRKVLLAVLVYFVLGLGGIQLALVALMLLQLPIATGVGLGISATMAGVLKLPSNILSGFGGWASGALAERRGSRLCVLAGSAILALGWVWLGLRHGTVAEVMAGSIMSSLGTGMILASVPGLIVEQVAPESTSEASGLANVARGVGTAIGAQIVTQLLAAFSVGGAGGKAGAPTALGMNLAFGWVVAATLAGLFVAWLVPAGGRARHQMMSQLK
jgi:MFS family permease